MDLYTSDINHVYYYEGDRPDGKTYINWSNSYSNIRASILDYI